MSAPRVVVAGAGPVGLVAAVGLARHGVDVVVCEQAPAVRDIPRASTFHPPTLELLDELDLAEPLIAQGYPVDRIQYRERASGVVAEFDYGLLAAETRYPFRLQCPQNRLAELAAARLPDVRFGARVVGVRDHGSGVHAELADGSRIAADWLIGADGASSAVRPAVGVGFDGMTYPTRNLQLITDFPFDQVFPDLALVNYVFDPHEWGVIMRTPPEVWRVLLPVGAGESDDEAMEPGRLLARLRTLIGDPTADVAVLYRAVYTVHQRVAGAFRVGRTLLVGDAAHVNSPIGGMGMNNGIHDACTLAPLLGAVVSGRAPATVLDGWAARRRDVALRFVQEVTDGNARMMTESDPAARARRNADLRERAASPARAREYLRRASMLTACGPG